MTILVNHQAGHFGNEHVNHDDPVIRNREKQKKKTLFRRQE
jgi:hypothetical protein